MNSLKDTIQSTQREFSKRIQVIKHRNELEQLRIAFLGRHGTIKSLMDQLKQLSLEEKHIVGPLLNAFKQECQEVLQTKKKELIQVHIQQQLKQEQYFDVTAYFPKALRGSLHPLTYILQDIENIFISMGYMIADGPEHETEYYNFEALNIPKEHPARDMWDTFYLDVPGTLMRTHTSPVQIHAMEEYGVPLALIAPGRCYRHEATDASHDFLFMQAEGLLVDTGISMSHLLATMKYFLQAFFDKQNLAFQIRPSYFPFVKPGIEIDMSCPFCTQGCSACKKTGWIEICGAGLVHPHVLYSCSIDPSMYSGFAFGFGLTRLAMLKYGINDIRLLHSPRIDFLEQF